MKSRSGNLITRVRVLDRESSEVVEVMDPRGEWKPSGNVEINVRGSVYNGRVFWYYIPADGGNGSQRAKV